MIRLRAFQLPGQEINYNRARAFLPSTPVITTAPPLAFLPCILLLLPFLLRAIKFDPLVRQRAPAQDPRSTRIDFLPCTPFSLSDFFSPSSKKRNLALS